MRLGNVNGEINNFWQVVHDSGELESSVSSYDITGLEGDTDIEYQLISRVVSGSSSNSNIYLGFNSDTTASNYGSQRIFGQNTTAGAGRYTSAIPIVGYTSGNGDISLTNVHIFSKSGKERTLICQNADGITSTTVEQIQKRAGVWDNTVDEITSINIASNQTAGLGIGSRFILLKKVHANDGMKTGIITPNKIEGAWERIYSNTLTNSATSVTISDLEGDKDQVYKLICRFVSNYSSGMGYSVRPNNDSNTNYGNQSISCENTNVSPVRSTGLTNLGGGYTRADNRLSFSEGLIYAKSGYERTALFSTTYDVYGTTIWRYYTYDSSWNNTADEITSINIVAGQTNGMGAGTNISLYRLNL